MKALLFSGYDEKFKWKLNLLSTMKYVNTYPDKADVFFSFLGTKGEVHQHHTGRIEMEKGSFTTVIYESIGEASSEWPGQ